MAVGVNRVILVGTLGRDPDVRYQQEGKAVAKLSVATSEAWKDREGVRQERTEWHRCVLFGALAELAGQHLSKGRQVYLEGKNQTKKWQAKDGTDRYTTEVVVQQMQFLGKKGEGQAQSPEQYRPQAQTQPQQVAQAYAGEGHYDEADVPF